MAHAHPSVSSCFLPLSWCNVWYARARHHIHRCLSSIIISVYQKVSPRKNCWHQRVRSPFIQPTHVNYYSHQDRRHHRALSVCIYGRGIKWTSCHAAGASSLMLLLLSQQTPEILVEKKTVRKQEINLSLTHKWKNRNIFGSE